MEFIRRLQPTTDESPPWAGIAFKLSVDSDALHERLKSAYPDCRTLRERKHQAAIDFLQDELRRMQSKSPANFASPEARQEEQKVYIDIVSDKSRQQSASTCTSPSVSESVHSPGIDRARPSPGMSMNPNQPQPSTPSTNPQQFVWSAHDGRSMRPKTKRKMTVEERSAYKETRKRVYSRDRWRLFANGGGSNEQAAEKVRCPASNSWSSVYGSRRSSIGLDMGQPEGLKAVKTDHASDVHHLVSETPNPFQSSLPTQQTIHERTNGPSESVAEATSGNRRWEGGPRAGALPEEYVFTEPTMDQFAIAPPQGHETWPPYSTQSPAEPLMPRYADDARMNRDAFSPQMPNPPTGDFSFEAGYPFYVDPWSDGPNQPVGTSGPS